MVCLFSIHIHSAMLFMLNIHIRQAPSRKSMHVFWWSTVPKKIPHQKGLFILWPLAARLNSKRACNIKYICLVCILFWQISIYLEMFVAGPLILGGRGFYSIVFTKVYWLKAAAPKNKGQKQFDKHWNLSKKLPNIYAYFIPILI